MKRVITLFYFSFFTNGKTSPVIMNSLMLQNYVFLAKKKEKNIFLFVAVIFYLLFDYVAPHLYLEYKNIK